MCNIFDVLSSVTCLVEVERYNSAVRLGKFMLRLKTFLADLLLPVNLVTTRQAM
jgi:hypothetical protein